MIKGPKLRLKGAWSRVTIKTMWELKLEQFHIVQIQKLLSKMIIRATREQNRFVSK
jgi:hypothetical protein